MLKSVKQKKIKNVDSYEKSEVHKWSQTAVLQLFDELN